MSKRDSPRRAWRQAPQPIRRTIVVQALLLTSLLALVRTGFAQETADYFRTPCTSCHTIGGGPPCISCHTVGGIGPLGGGRLGPDLTLVNERLGGPKGSSTWLLAPPTPTMQSVFKTQPLKAEEIHAVAAFLNQGAQESVPAANSGPRCPWEARASAGGRSRASETCS